MSARFDFFETEKTAHIAIEVDTEIREFGSLCTRAATVRYADTKWYPLRLPSKPWCKPCADRARSIAYAVNDFTL